MIEEKSDIVIPDKNAQFYLTRLAFGLHAFNILESGKYPCQYYQSEENGISLPVYPQQYEKGLRFGLLHALTGYYSLLARMGYKFEVEALIKLAKEQCGTT